MNKYVVFILLIHEEAVLLILIKELQPGCDPVALILDLLLRLCFLVDVFE